MLFLWASYQIRKIAGCACAGNAGNVFPRRRFQRKPLVSDPGMHHGTCVTHVPRCMSGSLTCGDGENVPGIPGACAPAILRIWQEAHGIKWCVIRYMKLCLMLMIDISLMKLVLICLEDVPGKSISVERKTNPLVIFQFPCTNHVKVQLKFDSYIPNRPIDNMAPWV